MAPAHVPVGDPDGPTKLNQLPVRWLMLALQCVALIGSYYCYDNPAALETPLKSYFGVSATNATDCSTNTTSDKASSEFNLKFNLLYTVYSVPNTVLPFFGGYFCDKLGIRLMTLVFAGFITIGQFIFALGLTLDDVNMRWWVMWIGRVVFGFGGESLSVAQSAMIAKWFVGKELALALGMNLALARVGSVVNDEVSIAVANEYKVYYALWVGFLICIVSLLSTVWVFFVDRSSEKRVAANLKARGALKGGEFAPEPEEIDLKAVFKFPLIFWILTMSCLTVYCTVLPFNNIASGFISSQFLVAPRTPVSSYPSNVKTKANTIMMITYLTAGLLSPILGGIIDRVGYRGILNVIASALIVGVHLTFRFSDLYPVVPLLVLGLCYSIYASALWPSVALVVSKEHTATAYGVVTAIQNLGLALSPLVIGALQPPSWSVCNMHKPLSSFKCDMTYNCVEDFFITLGICGVVCGLLLNLEDRRRPVPVLNLSEGRIAELVEKHGDLNLLNAKGKGVKVSEAMEGLLEGQSTPTLYDVAGGPIVMDQGLPSRSRNRSVNSLDAGRPRSLSVENPLMNKK